MQKRGRYQNVLLANYLQLFGMCAYKNAQQNKEAFQDGSFAVKLHLCFPRCDVSHISLMVALKFTQYKELQEYTCIQNRKKHPCLYAEFTKYDFQWQSGLI